MILVVIYISTIFFAKDYFSIEEIGILFIFLALFWLLISYKNISWITIVQPIILMIIGIFSFFAKEMVVLKSFPLILSILFFFAFIYAQLSQKFFLLDWIKKFKSLDEPTTIYLEKTHVLWVVVAFINVSFHSYFLFYGSLESWMFYTTVGWYLLLACAIVMQIAFRKIYVQNS